MLTKERRWWGAPRGAGEATNTTSVFQPKKGDCRSLVVTTIVKVLARPTMGRSSIEESENKLFVAKQGLQVLSFLIIMRTERLLEETFIDLLYFWVCISCRCCYLVLKFLYLLFVSVFHFIMLFLSFLFNLS